MAFYSSAASAQPQDQAQGESTQQDNGKPNILVIFGDDVGQTNVSAYSMGLVGYRTPNIDSIAHGGMMFTDYYAENSCTAGRSTFITGENILRSGLSKVGMPGANAGLQASSASLAQALKAQGYATGQFGKNHLGDRDEFLPTAHGFDEFFGNLYHLNAEEEPERPYWPKDNKAFLDAYNPRGVIHSFADGKIEDTGPLTVKRMETIDDETTAAAIAYMQKQAKAGKPFFTWMNFTRMHMFTHVAPAHKGKAGLGDGDMYADGMWEMDQHVGQLLKTLDDLGITKNTIVIYTTDNGPNFFSWPDAANTPFRSEKDSNWEGAYRVPAMIRWPGHIPANTVSNTLISGLDWFPTLVAAAGNPDISSQLLKGVSLDGHSFKNHLDGYNFLPYLTGKAKEGPRTDFIYFNDEAEVVAIRFDMKSPGAERPTAWKAVFCEQRAQGGFAIWQDPFICLRTPKLFNLRMDPYERADIGPTNGYNEWVTENAYLLFEANRRVFEMLKSFKDYPPAQSPDSFSIDKAEAKLHGFLLQKEDEKNSK